MVEFDTENGIDLFISCDFQASGQGCVEAGDELRRVASADDVIYVETKNAVNAVLLVGVYARVHRRGLESEVNQPFGYEGVSFARGLFEAVKALFESPDVFLFVSFGPVVFFEAIWHGDVNFLFEVSVQEGCTYVILERFKAQLYEHAYEKAHAGKTDDRRKSGRKIESRALRVATADPPTFVLVDDPVFSDLLFFNFENDFAFDCLFAGRKQDFFVNAPIEEGGALRVQGRQPVVPVGALKSLTHGGRKFRAGHGGVDIGVNHVDYWHCR